MNYVSECFVSRIASGHLQVIVAVGIAALPVEGAASTLHYANMPILRECALPPYVAVANPVLFHAAEFRSRVGEHQSAAPRGKCKRAALS